MSNLLKSPRSSHTYKKLTLNAIIDPALDGLTDTMSEKDIQETLDRKIEAAKSEAAKIIESAKQARSDFQEQMKREEQEATKKRESAFRAKEEEGYQQGYQKGTETAQKEYQNRIARANDLIDEAHKTYLKTIESAEPDILKLSIAVAEKILGIELSGESNQWLALVSKAVREARDQGTIKITVSPQRFQQVNGAKAAFDPLVQGQKVYIYMNSDFSENDCTVETAYGKIDAGVSSQLEVIRCKLKEIMDGDAQ